MIRIENYKDVVGDKNVVGIFDVYFEKSTEVKRNLKLVKSQKGHHFISYPSFSVENEFGEKTWHKFYEFSAEKQKEFDDLLLQEVSPFVKGGIVRRPPYSQNRR